MQQQQQQQQLLVVGRGGLATALGRLGLPGVGAPHLPDGHPGAAAVSAAQARPAAAVRPAAVPLQRVHAVGAPVAGGRRRRVRGRVAGEEALCRGRCQHRRRDPRSQTRRCRRLWPDISDHHRGLRERKGMVSGERGRSVTSITLQRMLTWMLQKPVFSC
ncbi:hypothetical protein VTK73DRAFT_4004 [Phialemonium thermophilum]|uniref:Uncharacterized protein n=1 Tax=Phialemonium thermophilum TaxID=223376 RepID=A0ABR3VEM7_9PEZI